MSNISRRKFLKGAGVAALAVAATGVNATVTLLPLLVCWLAAPMGILLIRLLFPM